MRVAMIGHKRIPSREGGIEVVVEQLAVRMAEQGNYVAVYNRRGHHVSGKIFEESAIANGMYKGIRIFSVFTFRKRSLNAIVYTFFASIRALFGRYDIVHVHAEGPCSMLWLFQLMGIHTVATIHGLDWQRSKWGGFAEKFLLFGERMAVLYADEIIVLSHNVQNYFKEKYGRSTVYIPNGVDCPEPMEASIIKEKYGLEKDSYLLFLARIVPEKGLHYLIEAYKKLNTDKKLVIAGGSSHTDEYMTGIMSSIQKDPNIIFTNFVQGQELRELYSNAYLYILPSDVEGMPISLLEAMSYGNCCLTSDIPENREIIQNVGVLFKKGNADDLKEQMEFLLSNEKHVEAYKKQASEYICKKYNWDDVTQETLKQYQKIIQGVAYERESFD